jgi:hypothetical protein
LLLQNDDIDIPAGEADHVIEASLELPVAVEVLGIYPHAHYLGKSVEAYVYDNTSANPRNPNDPPERVRWGNRSSDEMATLTLQVVPEQPAHAHRLREAVMRGRLERDPDDWIA